MTAGRATTHTLTGANTRTYIGALPHAYAHTHSVSRLGRQSHANSSDNISSQKRFFWLVQPLDWTINDEFSKNKLDRF